MKTSSYLILLSLFSAASLQAASLPESQKIDAILKKEWQKNDLKPNAPATDEVMVRRLYLDIAGRIPTVDETQTFMNSKDADKRAKLIDQLLASDGYTSNMFNYWADIMRLTDNVKGRVTAQAYAEYVKKCLKENKPYDQFVKDLITTDGAVWDSGAIGFYMRDENKLDHLAYTVQTFLGTSIVCAQCHNHPFDKWTQLDYYGMAAFTYGMDSKGYKGAAINVKKPERVKGRKNQPQPPEADAAPAITQKDVQMLKQAMQDVLKPLRYTEISATTKLPSLPKDYKYPDAKPNDAIQPKVMFGHEATQAEGETRLSAFSKWMASPENPRFTTVIANRMWKKAFGLGLIEPVDEMMDSTVPSNNELMEYLNQLMVENKYSLKSFLRVLYNTDTYQRSATKEEVPIGEAYHFTGPTLRRMSAEQVWDSMVTLSRGDVDAAVSEEDQNLHAHLGGLKDLVTSMHDKGAAGLIEIAKRGGEEREATSKKIEALRAEADKADTEGKTELNKKIAAEAQKLRKATSGDMIAGILGEDRAKQIRKGYGKKPANAPIDKAALASLSKEQRREALKTSGGVNLSVRASELPSPAPRGHFLRTFGQSDRELISNQSDEASVPQALALLNGPVADVLNNPLSKLHQSLNKAESPQQKVDTLYLSFLCRLPNANERAVIDQVIAERGDKALADVTSALLEGSQFLFVQ